jgi:hypothetical protein
LDDKPSEPAFWILEKTDDEWTLRLKRIAKDKPKWSSKKWQPTEELACYVSKADKCSYIKKLKLKVLGSRSVKGRYWPDSVTIEPALP